MTPRRALAVLAMAAVVATRIEPSYFTLPFVDRAQLVHALVPPPDSAWPQYPRFLEGVRERTARGDSIAIVIPDAAPREMYPLAYYRASYFLSGREVLPVIEPRSGEAIASNLGAARFVAAFGDVPAAGELVWKGEGGALYRR
ncbi:MAG TPA: hypothetical protein VMG61_09575 [Usitatibacter sp.]|nr:hypothetical protein [Usitatibacter sp.]